MKELNKLRSYGFWCYDYLQGGPVRKHYDDVKEQFENFNSPGNAARRHQNLEKILQHATRTTPYYSNFKNYHSIADFPIINRSVIKNNPSLFFSNLFEKNKLAKVTTSGSTGAPLTFWRDTGKKWRHTAENIYFDELVGSELGTKIYYLRAWNEMNRKGALSCKLQNIVMVDSTNLSDDYLENFLTQLAADKQVKTLLAYSSSLETLGKYVEHRRRQDIYHVTSVIAISETLPEGSKYIIEKFFHCPVTSRYSNIENGFLAQQCGDHCGEYHINFPSFYIEVLHPEKDEPVAPGNIGRVVVTDLFNYGMPLIRYDTGDMAVYAEQSACGRPGPVFTRVEGRRTDFIFATNGNPISPHAIIIIMWKYAGDIKQFQFIQVTKDGYEMRINPKAEGFNREAQLISDLQNIIGQDAKIQVSYTREMPVLASGKRRSVVNNYSKL